MRDITFSMKYILKHKPEDFVVEEVLGNETEEGSNYILCKLIKKNYDTFTVIKKLSKFFNIKEKDIGYAGIKDKKAITTQSITLPAKTKAKFEQLNKTIKLDDNISIELCKNVNNHIRPGDLVGNYFSIIVRSLDNEINFNIKKVPNYFGEQRFGKENNIIGENLVKKKFKVAAELALESQKEGYLIKEHLEKNPNDYVGALSKLNTSLLMLFIHSYQSFLWNSIVKEIIKNKGIGNIDENDFLEIPGFGSECQEKFEDEYNKVLENEGISERDFIIREFPKLSCQGDSRKILMEIKDFSYNFSDDEEFKNKKKCLLKFSLTKGSYATSLIEHLFNHSEK